MARSSKGKARRKRHKHATPPEPVRCSENHYLQSTNSPCQAHLTLQQEARNTEGRNLWRPGTLFRHQAVQFVSGGELQPEHEYRLGTPAVDIIHDESAFTAETAKTNTPDRMEREAADISVQFSSTPQDSSLKRQTLGGKQNETRGNRDAEDDHAENLLYEEIDVLADYIANIDSDYCDLNRAYGSIQSLPTKAYDPKPGGQYPVSGEHDVVAGHGKREIYHPGSSYVRRFEEMSSSSELDGIENPSQEGKGYFISRNNYKPEYSMFASATAFADALDWDTFYDLGIMDVDKPSPRKKWKGKRRSLPPEFSDSELGRELTIAWQNDREKKKAKKKKREDLRSRGQLGRPLGGVDLKAKYSNGMALDDLKEEICLFLQSSKISLPLPPMTKQRRKLVHELAHSLSLNSQSRGKGNSRFPILHKTSRTLQYTHRTISQVNQIFTRNLKHKARKSWGQNITKPSRVSRHHPDGSVSYMDGDIVGASAPEIGVENKGRAMLEKMGWSTGTALGASNNKGILLPVPHVVKNSKAGLG
ncbi:putative R3H and G-patch domain protein [Aspergillus tanneri]|uniref:Protein SQS1 n=1 Tax=Aspergillus tanneri TaxID=1220188 RepID=A0A5M9MKN0_9EURO|nr:uncharacterized protein ATNIH1004_006952 [Aspergillus tanneri]KAA8645533.1 hypothetical protein ATNIH1004_006952 [Aspergillus tanneri]